MSNSDKYELKPNYNNNIYVKELDSQLLNFYYLVLQKNHSKKENTWKSISII